MNRRDLDARLRDIENALLFMTTKLPTLVRDVQALRAQLNLPAEEPAAPPPVPEPEQQELGAG